MMASTIHDIVSAVNRTSLRDLRSTGDIDMTSSIQSQAAKAMIIPLDLTLGAIIRLELFRQPDPEMMCQANLRDFLLLLVAQT